MPGKEDTALRGGQSWQTGMHSDARACGTNARAQQGGHPVSRQVEQSWVTLLGMVSPEVVLQPVLLRCVLRQRLAWKLLFPSRPLGMVSKSYIGLRCAVKHIKLCGTACPHDRLTIRQRCRVTCTGCLCTGAGGNIRQPAYCIMVRPHSAGVQ